MIQPRLYLFAGPPGSGKTSVARWIHELTGTVHLWTDRERQSMFGNVSHSAAESAELYRVLNDRTEKLLSDGASVIFDTNFNYRADRDYLREIAHKNGADTTIIWMTTPVAVARERALHSDHRDRNHYDEVMSADNFDRLVAAFETPDNDEPFIQIDGRGLTKERVQGLLEL